MRQPQSDIQHVVAIHASGGPQPSPLVHATPTNPSAQVAPLWGDLPLPVPNPGQISLLYAIKAAILVLYNISQDC